MLAASRQRAMNGKATVFGYHVENPSAYGVVQLDSDGRALTIEEKPAQPKSNWAVTGLYFYDERVTQLSLDVKPSARGELEITDLNRLYMEAGDLNVEKMGRGYAWLDTGTHDSLLEASEFVRTLQHRQGIQLACLEEIAWQHGWVGAATLRDRGNTLSKTGYGQYILRLLDGL
jgi:glucose-1-phosphate thymidylyltransferase